MIRPLIHQIWVGNFKLPDREKGFVEQIKTTSGFDHVLWTDQNCPKFPAHIQAAYDRFYSIQNFAFCADLLRMFVVHEMGGFYLDIDFEINPNNSLNDFTGSKGLFLYHNDTDLTIPNNVFGAEKGSTILASCLEKVHIDNTWYGPSWMGITVKNALWLGNNTPQSVVGDAMERIGYTYYNYNEFEKKYARHWSLYSWSPEVWNKMRDESLQKE